MYLFSLCRQVPESDVKRRKCLGQAGAIVGCVLRLAVTPSSPRLPPASPALSALSDPEVVEWWTPEHLLLEVEKIEPLSKAVTEMQKYYAEWLHADRDPFWQRRSKKSVLSVLVCKGHLDG